jgi:hypothetical protein
MIQSIKALSDATVSPFASFISVLEIFSAWLRQWLQHVMK